MATWRSSLRRGLGLEGTWGSRTRPDPGAEDVAEEPLQRSRLKAIREKPCRKIQYRPRGSQHGIYYRSSSPNVEAEMEAQDAVSRLFPFGKYLLMFSVGQGSIQNSTSQTALPALAQLSSSSHSWRRIRNCQTCFQTWLHHFTIPQQYMRVPGSPCSHQHL